MKIRIDYLNKDLEVRSIITGAEIENVGFEIVAISKQGATDIRVYNITK